MIHGLCMNDSAGSATVTITTRPRTRPRLLTVYIRYNSGLHISTTAVLWRTARDLVRGCRTNRRVVIVGTAWADSSRAVLSLRGPGRRALAQASSPHCLLARRIMARRWSAAATGSTRCSWRPVHGAARASRRIRSAGITDLRHGNLLDEDWEGRDRSHAHGTCGGRFRCRRSPARDCGDDGRAARRHQGPPDRRRARARGERARPTPRRRRTLPIDPSDSGSPTECTTWSCSSPGGLRTHCGWLAD